MKKVFNVTGKSKDIHFRSEEIYNRLLDIVINISLLILNRETTTTTKKKYLNDRVEKISIFNATPSTEPVAMRENKETHSPPR